MPPIAAKTGITSPTNDSKFVGNIELGGVGMKFWLPLSK
jgi:hypothetical protein